MSNAKSSNHSSYVFVRVRPLLSNITAGSVDDGNEQGENEGKESSILKDLVIETNHLVKNNNEGDGGVTAIHGSLPITGFNGVFGINATNSYVYQESFLPRIETIMKGGTASFFCYGYTGAGKTHTTLGYNNECGVFNLAAKEILNRVTLFNQQQEEANDESLMIMASVMEVYNDEVFDLLSEDKAKCTLRKNKRGQLLVRGATTKRVFTEEEAEKKGVDYNIVTKTLSSIELKSMDDLTLIQDRSLKYRQVGISTEHNQSSRSHAIFRLDIVNQRLLDAMQELEEAEQIKPAVQTAYDKKRSYQLRHWVLDLEKKTDETNQKIENMYSKVEKSSPFGGRLILVDLAGADSDHRSISEGQTTMAQRKESTAINKSLMALKECIGALSTKKRISFRNSSLTRLLEEVLTPREKRDSDSVMIVNVGPEESLKSKTVNSLRYGSMFSSFPRKTGGSKRAIANRSSSSSLRKESLMEAKRRMKREMMEKQKKEGAAQSDDVLVLL